MEKFKEILGKIPSMEKILIPLNGSNLNSELKGFGPTSLRYTCEENWLILLSDKSVKSIVCFNGSIPFEGVRTWEYRRKNKVCPPESKPLLEIFPLQEKRYFVFTKDGSRRAEAKCILNEINPLNESERIVVLESKKGLFLISFGRNNYPARDLIYITEK